jgi:Ser/Thr protein kinase RdoA (MazF antagonist)
MGAMALAALHTTLQDCQPAGTSRNGFTSATGPRVRDLSWYLERVHDCEAILVELAGRGWADELLGSPGSPGWLTRRLSDLDDQLARARLPRHVVHGDYGPYNVLFRPDMAILVVDFELARLDWRLTDLAWSLRAFAWHRGGFDWDHAATYLQAYRSRRSLGDDELEQLASVWQFLALRRFVVCIDHFRTEGDVARLAEAELRLRSARWAEQHEHRFPRLWGAGSLE